MTSPYNVYACAINRTGPAYLPVYIEIDFPWFDEQDPAKFERIRALQAQIPDDIFNLSPDYPGASPKVITDGVSHWKDHWGTGWVDDGHGARTDSHPLADGLQLLDTYTFPDPRAPGMFDAADARLKQRGDRYMLGSVWFTLFERMWMVRGFDNVMVDPFVDPDAFVRLRDSVLDYDLAVVDQWLERKVDGIFISDDWGSQRGMLIDPELWRDLYKPSYKKLFARIHEGGAHVWMHLCGNITAILPDLIEVGLDVLNPVQPQAMDIDELARDFGGKVCFFGGADVQGTLVRGTPDDVRREARRLVDTFHSASGGYIASTSHGFMKETPLDNIIALYEAWIEYLP
jgi:uroporphyrinogen decarboxylase